VVIVGCLIFPLLFLNFQMHTYDLINHTIGIHASRFHGYTFFVLLFYRVISPFYWVSMWLIDRRLKQAEMRSIQTK